MNKIQSDKLILNIYLLTIKYCIVLIRNTTSMQCDLQESICVTIALSRAI